MSFGNLSLAGYLSALCLASAIPLSIPASDTLANPSFANGATGWNCYQCDFDGAVSCDDEGGSLRFVRGSDEKPGQSIAHAVLDLNQTSPSPFVYGCSVKTRDVSVAAEPSHARLGIELHVEYVDGSDAWTGPREKFEGGTHEWQRVLTEFHPLRAVRRVTFYCRSRLSGTAWFDGFVFKTLPPPPADSRGCSLLEKDGLVVLENEYLRAVFEPSAGGTCRDLTVKATGENFAGVKHPASRLFADKLRGGGTAFRRAYDATVLEDSPDAVELSLKVVGLDGHPFLEIEKRFRLERTSSSLDVRYVYHNLPAAMSETVIEPYFRLAWTLRGADRQTYYLPTSTGVKMFPSGGGDTTVTNVVAGWIAAGCEKSGTSMACEFDFAHLAGNYLWLGGDDNRTAEWWFMPVKIPAGERFETRLRLYPVKGVGFPDGAENGIACGDGGMGGDAVAIVSADRRLAEVSRKTVDRRGGKRSREDWLALTPDQIVTMAPDVAAKDVQAVRTAVKVAGAEAFSADRVLCGKWTFRPRRKKAVSAEVKPFSLTLSDEVVSPHTAWAKPFVGGRPKVLVLADINSLREAVELKERVDMQILTVRISDSPSMMAWGMCERFNNFTYEDMNASLRKELSRNPDVLLVCGGLLAHVDAANRTRMAELLKKGTGLVAVDPRAYPSELAAALQIARPETDADPLAGVPSELFPHQPSSGRGGLSCAGVSGLGGRSVVLRYNAWLNGLTPYLGSRKQEPDFRYQDYSLGVLGRAVLWASGRMAKRAITDLSVTPEGRISAAIPVPASKARVSVCNALAGTSSERIVDLGGSSALTADVGLLKPGLNICDVVLLDDRSQTLDWAHTVCRVHPSKVLSTFSAVWKEGRIEGVAAADGEAVVSLLDGYGRLLDAVRPGEDGAFVLEPKENLTGTFVVEARVSANGVIQDRQRKSLAAPRAPQTDPCLPFAIGEGVQRSGIRRYLVPLRLASYRAGGVNEIRFWHTESNDYFQDVADGGFATDFPVTGTHLWTFTRDFAEPYAKTGDRKYLCRKPCFDDPEWRARDERRIRACIRTLQLHAPASFDVGDENSLTLWGIPFDFCFCDHTLAAFQNWLRREYGSLESLNAEWRTAFGRWEDVTPLTTSEARAQHKGDRAYAAWADHRRYMELNYCGYFAAVKRIVSEKAPGVKLDMSGTQQPNGYTGMDMWLLSDTIDIAAAYDDNNLAEIVRSFGRPLIKPWYGYGSAGPDIGRRAWFDAFRFRNYGVSFYDWMNFLLPDFTLPQPVKDLQASLEDLRRGGGLLLRHLEENPQVLIHYSQASIHAAAIENRTEEFLSARSRWCRLLDDAHVPYRFVAYGEIERGDLAKLGVRILVLPQSTAMSDREVREVERFAAAGGLVLGDADSNVMNEHCTLRAKGGLRGLVPFDLPLATVETLVKVAGERLPRPEIGFSETQGTGVRTFVYQPSDGGKERYLGFVRETNAKGPETVEIKVSLPQPMFVHDMRQSRALGRKETFPVRLEKSQAAFFALLPNKAGCLSMRVSPTVTAGEVVSIELKTPGLRFDPVAVTLTDPNGRRSVPYSQVVACEGGKATVRIRTALNDSSGVWRVRAEDFIGGTSAEGVFSLGSVRKNEFLVK